MRIRIWQFVEYPSFKEAYVEFVYDEVAEEITHIAMGNETRRPFKVTYGWKPQGQSQRPPDEFALPANTEFENLRQIPPGQRKFQPTVNNGEIEFDSEIQTFFVTQGE